MSCMTPVPACIFSELFNAAFVRVLGMGGIETTRQLMQRHAVPIVLISDAVNDHAQLCLEGLAAGAVELVRKPSALELRDPTFRRAWIRRLRSLAQVPLVTRFAAPRTRPPTLRAQGPELASLVALGASTGGPRALVQLIGALGPAPAWPVLVIPEPSPDVLSRIRRPETVIGCLATSCARLEPASTTDSVVASPAVSTAFLKPPPSRSSR